MRAQAGGPREQVLEFAQLAMRMSAHFARRALALQGFCPRVKRDMARRNWLRVDPPRRIMCAL